MNLAQSLPHSEEAERAVLACILLDPDGRGVNILALLKEESFYFEHHSLIFGAAARIHGRGDPVDRLTIEAELGPSIDFAGGSASLVGLDLDLPDMGRWQTYVDIVRRKAAEREIFRAVSAAGRSLLAQESRLEESLDDLTDAIENARATAGSAGITAAEVWERRKTAPETFGGRLYTGLWDLDSILSIRSGMMLTVAGGTGKGKTSFALGLMHRWLSQGHRVHAVSLEMPPEDLLARIAAARTSVSFSQAAHGPISGDLVPEVEEQSSWPLTFSDGAQRIDEIMAEAEGVHARHGVDVLVVDYAQLIEGDGKGRVNREREVNKVFRRIKSFARNRGAVAVALSQLSRKHEIEGREPELRDLRESGGAEQHSDAVLFIWSDPDRNENLRDLLVKKQRHGVLGRALCAWDGPGMRFLNFFPGECDAVFDE